MNIQNLGVEHPPARQTQQPLPGSAQKAISASKEAQIKKAFPSCPPSRRSARAKGALVYDQKYHPMDDIIRPSQAAKRRSIHGERPNRPKNLGVLSSDQSDSDVGSMAGDEDSDGEEPQPFKCGDKRKRSGSRTPDFIRRSSRRRTNPNVLYNTKVHPQDSDLQRVYACNLIKSSPSPSKREGSSSLTTSTNSGSLDSFEEACRALLADTPKSELKLTMCQPLALAERDGYLASRTDNQLELPSPEPSPPRGISTESPIKSRGTFSDKYSNLNPDIAYLTGDSDAWPNMKGRTFQIFAERIEDQLNAEAEAASPFHYDDDDKENDVTNPELVPMPNALDSISIIPASHYRQHPGLYRSSDHSMGVSSAFYMQPLFEASPYGLGWSDGANDANSSDTSDCPFPDYMRILASSDNLPRSPSHGETRPESSETSVIASLARRSRELETLR